MPAGGAGGATKSGLCCSLNKSNCSPKEPGITGRATVEVLLELSKEENNCS